MRFNGLGLDSVLVRFFQVHFSIVIDLLIG